MEFQWFDERVVLVSHVLFDIVARYSDQSVGKMGLGEAKRHARSATDGYEESSGGRCTFHLVSISTLRVLWATPKQCGSPVESTGPIRSFYIRGSRIDCRALWPDRRRV